MAKSQLSSREAELKQMRTQNEQTVMRKDFYIEALQTQLRKTTQENAEETHKLKSTVKGLHEEISKLLFKELETRWRHHDRKSAFRGCGLYENEKEQAAVAWAK